MSSLAASISPASESARKLDEEFGPFDNILLGYKTSKAALNQRTSLSTPLHVHTDLQRLLILLCGEHTVRLWYVCRSRQITHSVCCT